MSRPKILVVLTSHRAGWYLPEFAHPYDVLSPHVDLVVASPLGGEAPIDLSSVELFKEDTSCVNFFSANKALWENTEKLESFLGHAKEYAAIFYVGGHGPMFDLATSETSKKLIREFANASLTVSAVCHGVAALTDVPTSNGQFIGGRAITGFSNSEEKIIHGDEGENAVPFLLEDVLRARTEKYEKADEPWAPKIVATTYGSGHLITGQNPASAKAMAMELLKAVQNTQTFE
ncbi:class I glutamine amidotransferase-like protein [Xylogone sp. PMI_703]|nr:class I glutamine amidotransferase-like protein [Xylogone sp. PMI_703]